MPIDQIIKRELEVAFAQNAQRRWVKILKYVVLAVLIYFLWGTKWLWIVLIVLFGLAFLIHFFIGTKLTDGQKAMAAGITKKINRAKEIPVNK